jgi:MoaA/NifB/PqqE/SkfB family radical SAM enzyme
MCYVSSENRSKRNKTSKELSLHELIERVLKPACNLRINNIVLTDGEPLLRDDIIELLREGKSLGFHFYVGTNGLLLKGHKLDALLEYNADIHISIDGIKPETIGKIRGVDISDVLFLNSTNAISRRTQLNSHSRIVAMMVLQEQNIDEALDVIDFSLEAGFNHIAIQPIHLHGTVWTERQIRFNRYSDEFRNKLFTLCDKVSKFQAQGKHVYFSNYPGPIEEIITFFLNPAELTRPCRSPQFIYIDSIGNFRGCVYSKPISHINNGFEQYLKSQERKEFIDFSRRCHVCVHGCS